MTVSVGKNVASLLAQRQLGQATSSLSSVSERLASGSRITSAATDAAGLAISMSLQADTRVFTQGIRNLTDGVSFLQIGEGATQELTNIVTRITELATQAANGIYGTAQRGALDREASALQEEYNRILATTTFNGRNVFTALTEGIVLQGGGNSRAVEFVIQPQGNNGITEITRVNTDSTGAQATGFSYPGGLSNDGRYVVFVSQATNLVAGDTNGVQDIFLKDTVTGQTTRINTTSAGAQGTGTGTVDSGYPSITPDGRYVVFHSDNSNLVAGDTNGSPDVFIKDTVTGTTTRVSTTSAGAQVNFNHLYPSISADGRYVVFNSLANNLVAGDTNAREDIFMKDTVTGTVTRVSTTSAGAQATGGVFGSQYATITPDGRYVAFYSDATNLVPNDTNNQSDIFLKDTVTGSIIRVNTTSNGTQTGGLGGTIGLSLSSDGRFVTFSSVANNLVAGDTNGRTDIFLKDTVTGTVTRLSTNAAGEQATGGALADSVYPSMSADGRYVVFQSGATNLVPGDTNNSSDIFLKDTVTGAISLLSQSARGVIGNDYSDYANISADGRFISFYSEATNLVAGDTNGQSDVFVIPNPFLPIASSGLITSPMRGVSLTSVANARLTLTAMSTYQDTITSFRGAVGAIMYRLQTSTRNLGTLRENYTAADARIRDTDVAADTATLTALSLRQRIGASVLAQANLQPQVALQLLGG